MLSPLLRRTTALATSALHKTSPVRSFGFGFKSEVSNRIFSPVRSEDEFDTILLLCASARMPLLTFWTATWCSSCKAVRPTIFELLQEKPIGVEQGGVGFAEVEMDAPGVSALAFRYLIKSTPTLLSFNRQEAQFDRAMNKISEMKQKDILAEWIRAEAARRD